MEKFWSIPLTQWSCLCFWVQAKELWGGRRGLPTPVWLSLQPHCTVGDSSVHRKTILGLKLIYIHLCQLPRTPCRWVDGSVRATDEKEKGLQPHSRQEGWPEAFCPQLPSLSWPWLYPGRSFCGFQLKNEGKHILILVYPHAMYWKLYQCKSWFTKQIIHACLKDREKLQLLKFNPPS